MNSRNLRMNSVRKQLLLAVLVFQSAFVFAQDVTINALTGGVAASPLVAGVTNQAILGIRFDKAGGGTNSLKGLTIALTEDPVGRFSNVRLVRSDNDNSFDAADLSNPVGIVTVGSSPDEIVITEESISIPITPFGGDSGPVTRCYFLVVDVEPTVTGATAPIQASLATADVILANNTVLGSTVTGTNYSFASLTITLAQLTTGVAANPLGANTTDQALLGFSLTSNGIPDFTSITINTSSTSAGKLTNIRLFSSANNSFGSDVSIATASSVTASTIVFTGLSEDLSGSSSNFFIVADIEPTVDASTPQIELSFDESNVVVSAGTVQALTITGTDYSFADIAPPVIIARNPADNATGVIVGLNTLQFTFDENVTFVGDNSDDDNRIRIRDLDASTFIETILLADVSVAGSVVTINFTSSLTEDTDYAIYIGNSVFEDAEGNLFIGISNDTGWNFETEEAPDITSLSNTTRCIGDQLIITGTGFTGTGGSGNTKPNVRINGFLIPAVTITAYSSTSITLTVLAGASTGNVIVENLDNGLFSNGSALTVNPQINTGLTVNPATLNPAQNTSVNISILSTQDNNYSYSLILTSAPGGYSLGTPATVHTDGGNNGTRTLNTSEGSDPDLTHIGNYTYRIDVSRTGCTTRSLTNTPFTLTVASLTASVNATSASVCDGGNSILIGSTSGGTGFYQFSWTGPDGFSSNSSSPTITPDHPAGTGWYILTLSDNSANQAKDSVYITTFPSFAVSFEPVAGEAFVQTEYTNQDQLFELNASPSQLISAGATFSGSGVVALSDSNKFYFNPQLAGNGQHTITYSYFNGNCTNETSIVFRVSNTFINNLDPFYCANGGDSDPLSLSIIGNNYLTTYYPSYVVTRFRFLRFEYNPILGYYVYNYYDSASQPQLEPLFRPNPVSQPYTYKLDIAELVTNHGIAPTNASYYVVVFAADANKIANPLTYPGYTDEAVLYNYFRIVPLGVQPNIVGINELENICADASAIPLSQSINGYSINNFSIAPPYSSSLSGTTFNPGHSSLTGSPNNEIPLTITLNYDDFNGCTNTTIRNFNWVKKPAAPNALDTAYCQITSGPGSSFTITATPNGPANNPYWYELDPVSNPPVLDSVNFIFTAPGITGLTPTIKTFYVTQSYKGCEGVATPVDIEIKAAPNANFTTPPICENRNFTLTGPLDGAVPYQQYDWDLSDIDSTVTNNNLITHNYGPGSKFLPIKLTVTNSDGCINKSESNITVGLNPKPTFTYQRICENDVTEFFSPAGDIAVDNYTWDFGDSSPIVGPGAFQNTTHLFTSGAGQYKVKLTAYTLQGCFDSDSTIVSILNYFTYTSDDPYEMALVDGGKGFWTIEDFKDSTTWEFNVPNKTLIQSASSAWVTNPSGNYKANDASVLNSPCLDISAIQRPVLSMDFISNTQERYDGAVLEFSIDDGLTWQALGSQPTGQNWFNTTSFISGKIGNSLVGWSGDLWETNNQWLEGRHAMDASIPLVNRSKVRLRMAFGSNADDQREGFAFANLSITERNRIILVENFTNESDPLYAANNTSYKALPSTELVKLQYHLSFPGPDAISADNKIDPNARAAFYGITNGSQIIPRVYVDGESKGNLTTNWFTNFAAQRTLKTSPFSITIETQPSTNPNELTVLVSAKALRNIVSPLFTKPVIHLAIVEKVVGNNEFVLRKLLPDATGTPIPLPLINDDSVIVGPITWSSTVTDSDDIAIVAFVQDEVSKEVYQAHILSNPNSLHLPTIVTGTEPTIANQIQLYPNPAQGVLNIRLPHAAKKSTPIILVDNFGREVYSNEFKIGEREKSINTTEFSAGVYIIQIKAASGEVVRKKVMITN